MHQHDTQGQRTSADIEIPLLSLYRQFVPRPSQLGLGFKYISTILKGSEQAPNFVDSPFIIVLVVICICSPTWLGLGISVKEVTGCNPFHM